MAILTPFLVSLMTTLGVLLVVLASVGILFRIVIRRLESSMGHAPTQSLWEILFTLKSRAMSSLLLTAQRAESGHPAEHPMGSSPKVDWLQHIGFDPATFMPPPLGHHSTMDLSITLGPRAATPLKLALPVLVAPMGYGVGLSAETKVALAQATTLAGTAIVSGEGPYLPEERAYAERWIVQESRGPWGHQRSVLRLADMIELQWGQGSEGGMEVTKHISQIALRARRAAQGPVVIQAAPYASLGRWVSEVKAVRKDCPIGVKLPASQHLERDLACLLTLPIDVITLDASGAGSAGSVSVISDHAGISAALATHRAHRWLVSSGQRNQITLNVSGGIQGAADIARLIALGADAVLVGTSVLFAALHEQIAPHLPTVPPTALAFTRSPQNHAPRLDVDQAAEHITNWFDATRVELETILWTLGFTSWAGFRDARPLIARSAEAARIFQIPFDGDVVSGVGAMLHSMKALTASYEEINQILDRVEESWRHVYKHSREIPRGTRATTDI